MILWRSFFFSLVWVLLCLSTSPVSCQICQKILSCKASPFTFLALTWNALSEDLRMSLTHLCRFPRILLQQMNSWGKKNCLGTVKSSYAVHNLMLHLEGFSAVNWNFGIRYVVCCELEYEYLLHGHASGQTFGFLGFVLGFFIFFFF